MDDHAQALSVRPLSAEDAATRLAGLAALDPSGMTVNDAALARAGQAFAVHAEGGDAVFVVAVRNGCAFVVAAKGGGSIDMTTLLDQVITRGARSEGCDAIAFQTARPGLVRKLTRRGFRVTGWVLKKDLQ